MSLSTTLPQPAHFGMLPTDVIMSEPGVPSNSNAIHLSTTDVSSTEDTSILPNLTCFVGVAIGRHFQYSIGGTMNCGGDCANTTLVLNYNPVTIYLCDPIAVCKSYNLNNDCRMLPTTGKEKKLRFISKKLQIRIARP